MTYQIVAVNDAAPGACVDVGLTWNGSTTLTATQIIAGTALTMSGTAAITGNTTVGGTLAVTGATTQTGALGCAASITLGAGADLIGSATSDIAIGSTNFTVAGATGNTVVGGTLTVDGAATITGAQTFTGNSGFAGTITGGAASDIAINTDAFTLDAGTKAAAFGGTMAIAGNTTLTGTLTGGAATDIAINTDAFTLDAGTKAATFGGAMTIDGATTQTGALTCAAAVAMGATANAAAHGAIALSVTELFTLVSSDADSDQEATLADGADGQMKIIKMEADGGNDVVVTPAHLRDGATITFDAANEIAILVFGDSTWNVVYSSATVAA